MTKTCLAVALTLASLAVGCANAPEGDEAITSEDRVENVGASHQALVEPPHPCSWAEMDRAEAACNDSHGYVTRTYSRSCSITACNATSTTIYYSYNLL